MEKVECQLESDSLHVRLLEGAGDVHVHVEEPVHGPSLLGLLDLQLGEEVDEPLEGPLVPVDPEEVDLLEVEDGGGGPVGPLMIALGTGVAHLVPRERNDHRDEEMGKTKTNKQIVQ